MHITKYKKETLTNPSYLAIMKLTVTGLTQSKRPAHETTHVFGMHDVYKNPDGHISGDNK